MVKRERLDTFEALIEAVADYQHLPTERVTHLLLEHYTVDLDILAQFVELQEQNALANRNAKQPKPEKAKVHALSAA